MLHLYKSLFSKSLTGASLPSGRYEFDNSLESERVEECIHSSKRVDIHDAPWEEQIVELFNHVNLDGYDGVKVQPYEFLMQSFLFPVVENAKEFRDQITNSCSKRPSVSGGFVSRDRSRSEWTCLDTRLCISWLIVLNCDDDTIARTSRLEK